ncbi:hypothetical protein DL764_006946 [Monosporascus ibericus]|uniref:Uncharacterized protein n=1 Tax=Monosporascus ibericus TaxID=155417 RepID=A0A4Q4T6M3_9PEZI|nr:hypothetical protein DL764_006946 [Monosporascus ibericus]
MTGPNAVAVTAFTAATTAATTAAAAKIYPGLLVRLPPPPPPPPPPRPEHPAPAASPLDRTAKNLDPRANCVEHKARNKQDLVGRGPPEELREYDDDSQDANGPESHHGFAPMAGERRP